MIRTDAPDGGVDDAIRRDPAAAAETHHDLVVVGGGVYGVMTALEAARRGLRPLLLERGDFGGETSWNSLRIAHGGLRYLQSLDLRRFRDSVAERSWLLSRFPDLVEPLPCLLPLYGRGLRRPSTLRVALALNDWLSRDRNRDVRADRALPGGRVVDAAETRELFPSVREEGLRGAALWWDASLESSGRLLVEALRWASAAGGTALNYVEATSLLTRGDAVAGVRAVDRRTGQEHAFRAPVVVNAAGPWAARVAGRLDREVDRLFRPSLAFNVLFDRPAVSRLCVGVEPAGEDAPTYFLRTWRGRLLAGTVHVPREEVGVPEPTEEEIRRFLAELRTAAPELELELAHVSRVFAGYLPVRERGTVQLSTSPVIVRHGSRGGPSGLISVSGVKFTTARRVAERTLRAAFPDLGPASHPRPAAREDAPRTWHLDEARGRAVADPAALRRYARRLCREEAVLEPEDLLFRRTDWWLDERVAALGEEAFRSPGSDAVEEASGR